MKRKLLMAWFCVGISVVPSAACADAIYAVLPPEKDIRLSQRERIDVFSVGCSIAPETTATLRRAYRDLGTREDLGETPHRVVELQCYDGSTSSEISPAYRVRCSDETGSWKCQRGSSYRRIRVGDTTLFMYVNTVDLVNNNPSKYEAELLDDQEGAVALLRLDARAARGIHEWIDGKDCWTHSWRSGEWRVRCFQEQAIWRKYSWRDYNLTRVCNAVGCSYEFASEGRMK